MTTANTEASALVSLDDGASVDKLLLQEEIQHKDDICAMNFVSLFTLKGSTFGKIVSHTHERTQREYEGTFIPVGSCCRHSVICMLSSIDVIEFADGGWFRPLIIQDVQV